MDWNGASRTNFFRVANIDGLRERLSAFPIQIVRHPEESSHYALVPETEYGEFPWNFLDENDEEVELKFETDVMPFVAEDEVVVLMESGSEGVRYMTGYAQAFVRRGDKVESVGLSLRDIYQKAAQAFHVNVESIMEASSLADLPPGAEKPPARPRQN